MSKDGANTTKPVLLAEDDPIYAELVCFTLETAGFRVDVAVDGTAARSKLASSTFDLAILDLNLPGVDGLTLLTEARTSGPNMRTPMVVMTGQNDSATTLDSYRLGATSFLAKPIDWPEFTLTIQQILRGSERQAEEEAASAAMRYWLARANRP